MNLTNFAAALAMELPGKGRMVNVASGGRSLEALLVGSVATRLAMAFLEQLEVQFLAVLQKTASRNSRKATGMDHKAGTVIATAHTESSRCW